MLSVDWGDVATWVQSIATSGTLIFTLYIVWGDRRRIRSQQARQIRVSLTDDFIEDASGRMAYTDGCKICVRNYSAHPITSVRVEGFWPHSNLGHFGHAGPKEPAYWQVLPPGEEQVSGRVEFRGREAGHMDMGVRFHDVEGREWRIDALTERIVSIPEYSPVMTSVRDWWLSRSIKRLRRKNSNGIEIEDDYLPDHTTPRPKK